MAQKSRFKMQTQGITTFRATFPNLPGSIVTNPSFVQTAHGCGLSSYYLDFPYQFFLKSNRLLTSGWWAYSRKPVCFHPTGQYLFQSVLQNYVADWTMSFLWGAIVGSASVIPYFYPVFFITVLVHRCGRDFERYVLFYPLLVFSHLTGI